jgi:sulfur-oxidizing protein SoxY
MMRRRSLNTLAAALALPCVTLRSAHATPQGMQEAIRAWAAGAPIRDGKVVLTVPPIVDNGNLVQVAVQVDSPMTAQDHVKEIAIFNDGNPHTDVARFQFTPQSGQARAALGIRLATTQNLAALARMADGSVWQRRVEFVVLLAACIE